MEPRKKNRENVMNYLNKAILTAAILALAAPAAAQENDSSTVYTREGEVSPGTQAPSRAALMQVIESGSPERLATLLEYGERVECHECVPLLERQLLESDDPLVREMSAWWLRRRPFGFAAVFRDIRQVLANDDDPVRRARAAEALGEFMDPNGAQYLRSALDDADARVREAAVEGLGRINSAESATGIVEAFDDADPAVREAAVGQVLYVNHFRDFDSLMGRLADENVEVRRRAALAIGSLRVADAVPALSAMLSGDESRMVRQAAAWALGRIGSADARAALNAQQELEDSSLVRDAIVVALRM
ncbi:MAG TPA: HEAT repeat domain-containing protein [Sandaracinaceae bacterium LLY-WYZ-13_1]|nr:HEAT repeat domain-containing protein [Sandaracinaceae bacterium LLY-WYZ-13_1]